MAESYPNPQQVAGGSRSQWQFHLKQSKHNLNQALAAPMMEVERNHGLLEKQATTLATQNGALDKDLKTWMARIAVADGPLKVIETSFRTDLIRYRDSATSTIDCVS